MVKIKIIFLAVILLSPNFLQAQGAEQLDAGQANPSLAASLDLSKNQLEHKSQLSLLFATGNTESLNLAGTSHTLWRLKRWQNQWKLGAFFNRIYDTSTGGNVGTTANYIYGNYRLDYFFSDRSSVFWGGGGYTDEIKGTDLAFQGFTGISHYLIRRNKILLSVAGGYNYTYEDRVPPDPSRHIHSAFIQYDYKHQLKDYLTLHHGSEFLESLNDTADFRINSDTELQVKISKMISLVVGFRLRFDNLPPAGFKKLDTLSDLGISVALP